MEAIVDVVVLAPTDERVRRLLDTVQALSRAILFAWDRWSPVEVVAIVQVEGQDVGLSSLAPHGEMRQPGPHIIGLWVNPEYRHLGVALTLLEELSLESQRRYGVAPRVAAVTRGGLAVVLVAQDAGVALEVQNAVTGIELP
jgi:ribosomal protein S18 acetylase RimI-like enzyme